MRHLKVFLAVLVLAIAACRSIPSDVRQAHDLSVVESAAAFDNVEAVLLQIEADIESIDDEFIKKEYDEWVKHMNTVLEARATVWKYLNEKESDLELKGAYATGDRLAKDISNNFIILCKNWEEIFTDPNHNPDNYIPFFRRDMKRFNELERKFHEWIAQFKVKG
jgi:hypothetical protein